MDLALAVNFWDAGPEAIGEDMHMYLKCFFSTGGKVIVKSIYSPASQCNIEGVGSGVTGYVSGVSARYTQAKRHLWGTLDFGYLIRRTILSYLAPESQCVVSSAVSKEGSEDEPPLLDPQLMLTMFHRMLEAHIIMGQFVCLLFASSMLVPKYSLFPSFADWYWSLFSTTGSNTSPYVYLALTVCFWMRMALLPINILTFYYYEKYQDWVGFGRWDLQNKQSREEAAALSSTCIQIDQELFIKGMRLQPLGKRSQLQFRRKFVNCLDWAAIPVAGILFYVMPQFHAQLTHLFTDRLDYKVAAKPVLAYHKPSTPRSDKGDEGYFEGDDSLSEEDALSFHGSHSPIS